MIDAFTEVFSVINMQLFLFAALMFFVGYALAPTAYFKKVKWLTAYPFFIIHLMDRYFKTDWHPVFIFFLLLTLNSFSLFTNILSGIVPGLPLVFAVLLGINIGVVLYHTVGGELYYPALLNPVAMIELPTAWISLALAFEMNLMGGFDLPVVTFGQSMQYFWATILPLLVIAAIIETGLIVFSRRFEADDSGEEKKKNNKNGQ